MPPAKASGNLTVLVADVYTATSATIYELHDLTRWEDGAPAWECETNRAATRQAEYGHDEHDRACCEVESRYLVGISGRDGVS